MNSKHKITLSFFGLCIFCCSYAYSKDYAIEIILFANKDGLYQTAEQFSVDQIIPVANDGLRLFSENDGINETENVSEDESIWLPLAEEDYILRDVANQLKRSGRYRILKHVAWRQPAVDRDQSQAIQISAGRDFSQLFPERAYRPVEFNDTSSSYEGISEQNSKVYELDGTIRVIITRYLHVYTDLVYRLARTNPLAAEDALAREQVLVDYAVNSHRKMRSRELHYIDHPLVGILVEATPIEEAKEEN